VYPIGFVCRTCSPASLPQRCNQAALSGACDTSSPSRRRLRVLKKLGHVDAEGVVTLKGTAACAVTTADELLAVELMFNGVFNDLDKHQLVALCSCLLPTEKSSVRETLIF
jgi:superfamily II RNA helicase